MNDEVGVPLLKKYGEYFKIMAQNAINSAEIDETNVYQPANEKNRVFVDKLVEDNIKSNSYLENEQNFVEFCNQVKAGKHGLILMEHYSNTDLPCLMYMLKYSENEVLKDLEKRIVAIAGMKLNQESDFIRVFAECFSRVVIYPTRSQEKALANAQSEEEANAEKLKARKINLASMRAMDACKKRGEVILVFPSGTRYRPGHPETKRGLREIDSYLRIFDIAILVSVNGNILRIEGEDMTADKVYKDRVVFTSSPVIDLKSFRNDYLASLPADTEDPKQKMIDRIMEILEKQHEETEKKRIVE